MSRSFRQPAVMAPRAAPAERSPRGFSLYRLQSWTSQPATEKGGHKALARIADTDSTAFDLLPNLPSFSKGANISSTCSQRDDGRQSLRGGGQSTLAVPRAKSTQRQSDNEKFRNSLNHPQGC